MWFFFVFVLLPLDEKIVFLSSLIYRHTYTCTLIYTQKDMYTIHSYTDMHITYIQIYKHIYTDTHYN